MKLSKSLGKPGQQGLVKNGIWGIASNIIQNVFLSVFFVIVARNYSTADFAQFLVATTLYQFVGAFSSLGLGQWFIREYIATENKADLLAKFLKMQAVLGVVFYVLNVASAFVLYSDPVLHQLAIVLGINVIFDNVIYSIKNLNTATFEQKKTFIVLIIDSVLRFLIGVSLLVLPFSVLTLSVLTILVRFSTVNLFIRIGVSRIVSLKSVFLSKIRMKDLSQLVYANWSFIIIGSISMVYWRIAGLIISKALTALDVATYEISFKIFLLVQVVPLMLSASVYPYLVKLYRQGDAGQFRKFYKKIYYGYLLFSLASYTFIYSYAGPILQYAFGNVYQETAVYTRQMFLAMLIFPTSYLQANVLVTMNLEKKDMWLNIISLAVYLAVCLPGLWYSPSLSVINYSIFISFIVFHLLQDIILIKRGVSTLLHCLIFYAGTFVCVWGYILLTRLVHPYWLFPLFWGALGCLVLLVTAMSRWQWAVPEPVTPAFDKTID